MISDRKTTAREHPAGADASAFDTSGVSRRGFIERGLAATAGTLLLPSLTFPGQRGQAGRLLIHGGTVLTCDRVIGDFVRGDVLIENGRIAQVGAAIGHAGAERVDASGMIVMPGFVDTHRHLWQGLLRNIGPDDLLVDYVTKILFGFAPKLTLDEVYLGNLVSALSAMNAGITSILDWSHIATSPAHADAAVAGLQEAGIRAVYAYGPNFGLTPPWYEDPTSAYPDDIHRLRAQYFSSSDQLLTLALAAAGPEFSNVDAAVREWQAARAAGARISVHVGVGMLGKQGLLASLATRVPLGDDTTYIHCATLSDAEWDLIRDSGGTISLAVPIEMQMGHGMPPIQAALDRGIRPSLSIDVETNQPTDMFTQMRACFALQRAFVNERQLFDGNPNPPYRGALLTVRDVLEFATIEGARANGLGDRTGSLTPGKEADVILLRADALNVSPVNDAIGSVVLGMDGSNVDSVFIAGRAVKRKGRLVGVNLERLLQEAAVVRDRLRRRVGL